MACNGLAKVISTVLKTLNDRLNELSELHTDSKDVILLKSLSGIIKNKFGCNNDKIEYPDVVKWCLDNKMIQQAITIYVEKMPEYFYKKQYFTVTDDILESVKIKNETSHNDFYYELFYSSFLVDLIAANDRISIIFAEIAKFIKDNTTTKLPNYISSKSTSQLVLNAFIECTDYDSFMRRVSHKSFKNLS